MEHDLALARGGPPPGRGGMNPVGAGSAAGRLDDEVRRVLDEIRDPCSIATSVPMGLVEMGIVKTVRVSAEGEVDIELRLTSPVCEMVGYMMKESRTRIAVLPGVTSVNVRHDAGLDWTPDLISPEARARRTRRLETMGRVHALTRR